MFKYVTTCRAHPILHNWMNRPLFFSFMGSRFHRRFRRARSTATRKYRFLSVLSRLSFHGQDSNNSTSGGTCKTNLTGRDLKLTIRVKSTSDDDSRSNVRTERTIMDQVHLPSVTSTWSYPLPNAIVTKRGPVWERTCTSCERRSVTGHQV